MAKRTSRSKQAKQGATLTQEERNALTVAFYDFRGKQEYIYRTNRVKEIIGASEIIKNAYKDFIEHFNSDKHPAGKKIRYDLNKNYSTSEFAKSEYAGEVLYEGGGNITILFKDEIICRTFNKEFSLWLVEHTYSLSLLCAYTTLYAPNSDKEKTFKEIRGELAQKASHHKLTIPLQTFANVLPFTQIDRNTALPITEKTQRYENNQLVEEESLSRESFLKIKAYKAALQLNNDEVEFTKNFDAIATKKGVESLLAVIYIDGNGMGEQVSGYIGDGLSLDKGVKKMREFSKKIDRAFIKDPMGAILDKLKTKSISESAHREGEQTDSAGKAHKTKRPVIALRQIVGGGDEITLVCNAREAFEIVRTYFDSLATQQKSSKEQFSACAGIALFNSHAPFSVAYELAEECCENGKKRRQELLRAGKETAKNNCYLDFFFMISGVTGELEAIRNRQYGDRTHTPYCKPGNDLEHSLELFHSVKTHMVKAKRANVKALHDAALKGLHEFEIEVQRIRSKQAGFLQSTSDSEKRPQPQPLPDMAILRKIVYDVATVYDVWFRGEED
jgi:CRISPR/Cas system-associated protein Cas10 (large subunit of type III CRISPR-Cas system)